MPYNKEKVVDGLYPLLSIFDEIGGQRLDAVLLMHEYGSLAKIVLDFDSVSLVVVADKNDDTIDCKTVDRVRPRKVKSVDGNKSEPWRTFIGRKFGWGWVTVNQQGCCDGLLLSFDGIAPDLLLNVIASSIKVARIAKLS